MGGLWSPMSLEYRYGGERSTRWSRQGRHDLGRHRRGGWPAGIVARFTDRDPGRRFYRFLLREKGGRGGKTVWGALRANGGAVAAPVYVLGSALGALLAARLIWAAEIAATLSEVLGNKVSADLAWTYFLFSLVLSAILEAAILISASSAAGAWAHRANRERHGLSAPLR